MNPDHMPVCKVAAMHVAPVFLDKNATTQKALALIEEAARNGAQLIAFPESFIPAFPVWAGLWAPIHNHDLFARMVAHSLETPGPEIALIAAAARRYQVFISIGISEKNPVSSGGIWNSNLLISDEGRLLSHHRKLMPTFYEKLVWAPGDGAGLQVAATRLGRIGMLICGENTNPLARYALLAQGEQIHIATWPSVWPTKTPGENGNYDNLAANRIRLAAHAFEGKLFGISCAGFMDKAMRDFLVQRDPAVAAILDHTPQAASMFVDPTGAQIGDCLQKEEGIAYCTMDLQQCVEPKQLHDVVGYYNRFDIFDVRVDRSRKKPITWLEDNPPVWPDLGAGDATSGSNS
ncbi:carbon-nitrogen hydrolase family protein [Massilia sp. W12]|uniref:carbon-nitrogen hydrolase family protein n=1 Tax=Massilia sp. W12 TaxID=3126507 RepID=UPI0030D2B237